MLILLAALCLAPQAIERTPAIYRCPELEAESEKFASVVNELAFDSFCIEPKIGNRAKLLVTDKLHVVETEMIDTAANLKWRNATIEYIAGRLSPAEWVAQTANLGETVHFLSSPSTKTLRDEMDSVPVPIGGAFSSRSVLAEMLLLSWPGKPCINSTDVWLTKELPDAGKLQSWVLAMNDWLGPMLYLRSITPFMVESKPTIIRADSKPGLLVFQFKNKSRVVTVCINNGTRSIELPQVNPDDLTVHRGVDPDAEKLSLIETGFAIFDNDSD